MDKEQIIEQTESFITNQFGREGSGHDWFHIDRVRRMALKIGQLEGGNLFVIELAALLHDLDDWKLSSDRDSKQSKSEQWMQKLNLEQDTIRLVLSIIEEVSFKGAGTQTPVSTFEAAVVQDADRLDAIGAIGIARTFAYGGHKSRLIYDPAIPPVLHTDFNAYKKSKEPTINHFYEKLLLLKDRLNTETARKLAVSRHQFMESFLERFFQEWETTQ